MAINFLPDSQMDSGADTNLKQYKVFLELLLEFCIELARQTIQRRSKLLTYGKRPRSSTPHRRPVTDFG